LIRQRRDNGTYGGRQRRLSRVGRSDVYSHPKNTTITGDDRSPAEPQVIECHTLVSRKLPGVVDSE
jgi:hypothetical protein